MDHSEGSAFAAFSGPRKRPRSPYLDNATPGREPVPMALDRPPTGAPLQVDIRSKRPRLSSFASGGLSSTWPEELTSRNHLTLTGLPSEVMQYIFTFVEPVTLGQLVCVNRQIRTLLDPACPLPQRTAATQTKHLALRTQDSIWTVSRRTFLPGFPKPMDMMTELEMWRLIRGHLCQFCGKKAMRQLPFSTSDPWSAGPGLDNVRPIWPFRVRSCGSCLRPRLIKDTELAFSSNSALRPGLPFTFFTDNLNYVPSPVIHHGAQPPHLELIKYYFRPQLEELETRFRKVEALGAATLGEWKKGLEASGQEKNADAMRFEQYELHMGFSRTPLPMCQSDVAMLETSGPLVSQGYPMSKTDRMQPAFSRSAAGTPLSGYIPLELSTTGSIADDSQSTAGKSSNGTVPALASASGALSGQVPLGQSASRPLRQRTERSHKEAKEAKAERRKEIERRCLALNPPLMPSTLTYMDAFQAAILISLPFDDKAWEVLKPRLMSQRADATQREIQTALSDPSVQQAKRRQFEEEQRIARENASHMWHGLKISSRDKLRKFAEEFVHLTWSDGRAVTGSTASKFAAEVLSHIRQRFDETIAQEDEMLSLKGTAFPQDPESLACRKLSLHDMKWAFLEFVQPHTQGFGKDLFLCHMCDTNQKLFAFEAIIQHFASKHTNTLSHGTSIVSWEADWPIEPPFDPQPNIPWALGGASSASKSQAHQQSRSVPSRGVPSISEREPRPEIAFVRKPLQHAGQPSNEALAGNVTGHFDQFPARHIAGVGLSTFTRSSVARSDASGFTREDDYHPQHDAALQRGAPGPPFNRDRFAGAKPGDHPINHPPLREAARYSVPSQDVDGGRWWGRWREERPLSHSSMVYSNDDGSSRYSYGDTLARAHGAGSETGRESEAASHLSLYRDKGSAPGSSLNDPGTSRIGVDQISAKSAVDEFFNSFNPTIGGGTSSTGRLALHAARSPENHLPLNMTAPRRSVSRPITQPLSWSPASSPPAGHHVTFSPPMHRASLPIRESERHSPLVVDPSTYAHYSSSLQSAHSPEVFRRPTSGDMYLDAPPGGLHQDRYRNEREHSNDIASAYTEPLYRNQYVYDHDGRKYQEIRDDGIGRYSLTHDRLPDHPRESYMPNGMRYVDDRDHFLDQAVSRGQYGRAVPRAYLSNNMEYRPQQMLGLPLNDQYREEEPLISEHRTRTIRWEDQDVIYQPVESPGRPPAWSLGMSRPEN